MDYGDAYLPAQAQSKAFVLDVSPPSGQVASRPGNLTPDGQGGIQPESFSLTATSKTASVLSWNLSVLGPGQFARRVVQRPGPRGQSSLGRDDLRRWLG